MRLKSIATLSAIAMLAGCAPPPSISVPPPTAAMAPKPVTPPDGMSLAAIPSGRMYAKAGLAYEGGAMNDARVFSIGAILVRHPKGALLFDAGFGPSVDQHFTIGTPPVLRLATKYDHQTTVAEELAKAGVQPSSLTAVVLTHAHWDHVSGLESLAGVPVWVPEAELAFVKGKDPAGKLARTLGTSAYVAYPFPDGPYRGFDQSRDVFGDGSVVLVPAGGHTPGSIIAFISLPDGKHYALIGDIAWQSEGVDLPAQKPWIARRVDHDRDGTRDLLIRLKQLKAADPALVVVPAHDARVWKTLPTLSPTN